MNKRRRYKAKAQRAFRKRFMDFMSARGVSMKQRVMTGDFDGPYGRVHGQVNILSAFRVIDAIGARAAVHALGMGVGAGPSPVDSSS